VLLLAAAERQCCDEIRLKPDLTKRRDRTLKIRLKPDPTKNGGFAST
jgi:hypothetical protein